MPDSNLDGRTFRPHSRLYHRTVLKPRSLLHHTFCSAFLHFSTTLFGLFVLLVPCPLLLVPPDPRWAANSTYHIIGCCSPHTHLPTVMLPHTTPCHIVPHIISYNHTPATVQYHNTDISCHTITIYNQILPYPLLGHLMLQPLGRTITFLTIHLANQTVRMQYVIVIENYSQTIGVCNCTIVSELQLRLMTLQ